MLAVEELHPAVRLVAAPATGSETGNGDDSAARICATASTAEPVSTAASTLPPPLFWLATIEAEQLRLALTW